MKEFKAKKIKRNKKRRKLKFFMFLFLFSFAYYFMFKFCLNNKQNKNILSDDINYINYNIKKVVKESINKKVNNPVRMLNYNVKSARKNESNKTINLTNNKNKNVIKAAKEQSFNPIVYVYNTHEQERYADYSVTEAASVLNDKLNQSNIQSIHENASIATFLQNNNLKYYKSYNVSRKYIEDAKERYNSLSYFFDIHRDSILKDKSTVLINEKPYAKILFIVGLENPSYTKNLENAKKLNNIINSKAPNISRGIMQKKGHGVNGVYNQDISENTFLIEVGGSENTKQEVKRSINIIYESILEYVKGVV